VTVKGKENFDLCMYAMHNNVSVNGRLQIWRRSHKIMILQY